MSCELGCSAIYNLSAPAWKTCRLLQSLGRSVEFSLDGLPPKPSGQKRFFVLFSSQIRICFILQSAPSPRASEDWKSGKCTGVYRPSGQHSSHNFLTMSLKKAVPDCPFHHNPRFDGRDRKLRVAGSVFHPETMAISFLAGMQSE